MSISDTPKPWTNYFVALRGPDMVELCKDRDLLAVLFVIAVRARYTDGPGFDGLTRGQARIGDYEAMGFRKSERQRYRTAVTKLEKCGIITIDPTSKGTIVTLLKTNIFDPFGADAQPSGQPATNHRATNSQPSCNQPATTNKNDKKRETEKENNERLESKAITHPLLTASPEFADAWDEWKKHKVEKNSPLTSLSQSALFHEIERECTKQYPKAGPENPELLAKALVRVTTSIRYAIKMNWGRIVFEEPTAEAIAAMKGPTIK